MINISYGNGFKSLVLGDNFYPAKYVQSDFLHLTENQLECPPNTYQPDASIFQPENGFPKFAQICFRSEDENFDPLHPQTAKVFFVTNENEMLDLTGVCENLQMFYPDLNLGVCENDIAPYGQVDNGEDFAYISTPTHPTFRINIVNGQVPVLVQKDGNWFAQEVPDSLLSFDSFVQLLRSHIVPISPQAQEAIAPLPNVSFVPDLTRTSTDPILPCIPWVAFGLILVAVGTKAFFDLGGKVKMPKAPSFKMPSMPKGLRFGRKSPGVPVPTQDDGVEE